MQLFIILGLGEAPQIFDTLLKNHLNIKFAFRYLHILHRCYCLEIPYCIVNFSFYSINHCLLHDEMWIFVCKRWESDKILKIDRVCRSQQILRNFYYSYSKVRLMKYHIMTWRTFHFKMFEYYNSKPCDSRP